MNVKMQCDQDNIQVGDVMVLTNGREISMLKTSVEQSPDQQLAAACIVHGNVIVPVRVSKTNGTTSKRPHTLHRF
eukprot:Em0007g492a